ncbi:MAG TPA: nif-specific transcriptional activator NifA [Polyangiaceae bacterium]|nr:nif-specific transcriptional activator NifA [Polyangiaceae bacterium]
MNTALSQVDSDENERESNARRAEVQLYGVYEISKLLASPVRLEVTLARVAQLLASFLDMRHGLIALLSESGMPEVVVGSGWSEATAREYFEHLPERAIGRIVATDMPLVIRSIRDDPLWENWDFGSEQTGDISFVGVPIRDNGKVIGTLTIDREVRSEASIELDQDVRFLTMVANLVGQTIRLQRLVAIDRERLMEERRRLERELEQAAPERRESVLAGIVGESDALQSVIEKVRVVARSNSTVLLRGESGTGKELFARAIHDLSSRSGNAFVKINCAALPESILESELFGHEKGAFTGAAAMRKGRFELANGGTLFLDEIGEISPAFQAKLLRVLQEGEFERVGGTSTLKVDVRLVAATNRNLEEAVACGEFRADLYYRISVIPIFLPPLRDRSTDIPILAKEFLRRYNSEHGAALAFAKDGIAVLSACLFPGNVRELENCVRRTATLAASSSIHATDFACNKHECLSAALWQNARASGLSGFVPLPLSKGPRPSASSLDLGELDGQDEDVGTERQRLVEAMESAGWVQAKAARLLGLTPRQIGYALRKYDIPIKKF